MNVLIPRKTIGDHWRESNGNPNAFNNIRTILALSIILWHTIVICYGFKQEEWFWTGTLRPVAYGLVPSFFALSGFLVAGSLLRNPIAAFVCLRVLRIYPALIFEVVLSAIILGPAVTRLSMSDYFSDNQFFSYGYNLIGYIHYNLPGVFTDLPWIKSVNTQLWTIPFEIKCYLLLIAVSIAGLHRRLVRFIIFSVIFTLIITENLYERTKLPHLIGRPSGDVAILCFLFGVALFLLKDKIKINLVTSIISLSLYSAIIYDRIGMLFVHCS